LGEKTTVTKMTTLRGSGGKSKKKSFKRVAAMGSDEDDEDADKIEEEVTTVASEDTTHTSSSSILNTNEVDTDAIADSVDGEDEDDETSVPSDVSYPHSEADELLPLLLGRQHRQLRTFPLLPRIRTS
jgi:TATA-binding protein-associated factor Taf7